MSFEYDSTRRISSKDLSSCRMKPRIGYTKYIANLVDALFTRYSRKFVRLEVIAADFLGISDQRTIIRLAWRNELCGIKAFKLRYDGNAPWLVDIEQLANALYWIPSERLKASEVAIAMLKSSRSEIKGGGQ